jgi:hypothetical protein
MAARQTGKAGFERQMRVSKILTKRIGGMSLKEIGEQENPPISMQAVHQMIKRVLSERVTETLDQARTLELMRLDQLLGAIWPQAMAGDTTAVDRVLAIMQRRARLMGLDLQPRGGWSGSDSDVVDAPAIRVEIVGNPEVERMRWLEEERIRLLEAAILEPTGAVN